MKLSEALSCFDGTPILKYGAKVYLSGDRVYIESPICNAVFSIDDPIPNGVSIPFGSIKTAIKHLDDCVFSLKEDSQLMVRGKGFRLVIPVIQEANPDISPIKPPKNALHITSIGADTIEKCLPYTGKDSSRAELCCVHVRNGWAEATNRTVLIRSFIGRSETAKNMAFYNTILAPIMIGIAKSGGVYTWSGDTMMHMHREGVYCTIPHITQAGDIPTMEELLEKLPEEPISLDIPLKTVLAEIKTITTICGEMGKADEGVILLKILQNKVTLETAGNGFNITKTIPHKHQQQLLTINLPMTLAANLPDFLPEDAVIHLNPMGEERHLLSIVSNMIEFYMPLSVTK